LRSNADIVADEVSNKRRVAGVVFGIRLLDFPDKVCTDIGGLRVDTAAQLGKECHEGTHRTRNPTIRNGVSCALPPSR
jgi:hypothetical protein